ncbi:hypothetical protein Goklo_026906 [Gossypium klotzschianum]|uniref:RING-type domain-containing protein n=1 Tax=Gossypium klotzschianum TaxID=34286 RepID=A0A7J8TWK8_9ROSI|nr:hypothetical protein [Gossypium klotzschianum]
MGLSNFPSAAEGVLPVLVMNTVLSVALLKNIVRSLLQVVGASTTSNLDIEASNEDPEEMSKARERRISITQFKSLCHNRHSSASTSYEDSAPADGGYGSSNSSRGDGWVNSVECCVCLCGFEADEEVSELSCKHFFHKGCLEKWFGNKHSTCPLCRSIH